MVAAKNLLTAIGLAPLVFLYLLEAMLVDDVFENLILVVGGFCSRNEEQWEVPIRSFMRFGTFCYNNPGDRIL